MTEPQSTRRLEHEHREGYINPGNEDYLSYYVYQNDWKPTNPIGTIGAMSSSPGSAKVYHPSTIGDGHYNPRKFKAPAFKIGEKDSRLTFSWGPSYDGRKLTNKGGDVFHAPIVDEKIEGIVPFTTPGPALYHRGDSDKGTYRKAPAYTMRSRTDPIKGFVPPAPISDILPDTLGPGRSPYKRSSAFTMSERFDKTGIQQQNPGPAAYELPSSNINKRKAPAFTMGNKEKGSKYGPESPGPASNNNHMVKFNKPATPRYSFGIQHTSLKEFQHFADEN